MNTQLIIRTRTQTVSNSFNYAWFCPLVLRRKRRHTNVGSPKLKERN